MIRLFVVVTTTLVVLFTAGILMIRAQPYDDGGLRGLLLPPEGCAVPCWLGLRPGYTRLNNAMADLRADSRVESLASLSTHMHSVNFSVDLDSIRQARLYLWERDDRFTQITLLEPDITPGELLLAIGKPEAINVFHTIQFVSVNLLLIYPQYDLFVSLGVYLCSLDQESFWKEPRIASITIGDWQDANGLYPLFYTESRTSDMSKWATELRTLRNCR